MNRSRVLEIISEVIGDVNGTPLSSPIDEDIKLIGDRSILDSLGLVSVILDVEQRVNEQGGDRFTIDHDRAMSRPVSPFLTIGSFADYVLDILDERQSS